MREVKVRLAKRSDGRIEIRNTTGPRRAAFGGKTFDDAVQARAYLATANKSPNTKWVETYDSAVKKFTR